MLEVSDPSAGVLNNDTPADGGTLTASVVTQPANGVLTLNADGSFTYTPNADYNGTDSFTYIATEGTTPSVEATVTLTVTGVNDAPTAAGDALVTDEDAPLSASAPGVLGNDADVDGDTLSAVLVTGPAHGTLTLNADGSFTYTPAADFSGSDGFTYKVNDGAADSAEATVTITVNSVNDAPTATAQSVATDEDTAVGITLAGSDTEGASLSFSVETGPAHGTLSGTAPDLTYTPHADYSGSDSFTFKVNDGAADSAEATVTLTVSGVNDAPVATDDGGATDEDTPLTVTVLANDTDADADALTVTIVNPAANGSAGVNGDGTVTYTPGANFSGSDSFTYKVSDGTVDSAQATVSITVNAVNDAPSAADDAYTTGEDVALNVAAPGVLGNDSDIEGSALSAAVVAGPAHGTLTLNADGSFTYTPAADFSGSDSFTYKANDGAADSSAATVTITVDDVNDAPVATAQSVTTDEDAAVSITLAGTDAEGSTLSFTVGTAPAHGTLTGTAPDLTYTPAADFNGTDSFTFKANDGAADSTEATVSITINAVNDAPTAVAQSVTTDEESALPITLAGTDPEGSALTFEVAAPPAHGILSGTAPNLTYTPGANYSGSDSFTFTVNDGAAASAPAAVSITVSGVNDAPSATGQSVTTDEDTAVEITLAGSDPDGDGLSFSVETGPAHGALSGTAPNLTYTPAANYSGSDSFTFKASDGVAESVEATVSITVNGVNDAPTATAQGTTTDEDTPVEITLAGSDPEGSSLSFVVATAPAHGTLSGTAPNLTYTPAADYSGSDSFTFKVNDGEADSGEATVAITVNGVNDAPSAVSQSVTTDEDTAVEITLAGSDPEGGSLSFSVALAPAHGTLTGTTPNLTYTPSPNFSGSDSFTFKVNDGAADSSEATVSITVNAVNDAPAAAGDAYSTNEDTPLTIDVPGVLGNDADAEGNGLSASLVNGASSGTVTLNADGSFTYTPNANFSGTDTFTYKATDGTADSPEATVTITVNAINDAPTAAGLSTTTDEDTAVSVTLAGNDPEGDSLSFVVESGPAHGTLSGTAPNLTYTPAADYSGTDSFTFKVNDGTSDSAVATVSITINGVNDAPGAANLSISTDEDTPAGVTLSGTDPEGGALTFTVVNPPAHGVLSGTAPNLTYTPNANYSGPDSFTYKANDGTADSAEATVSITVNAVNDAPSAAADAYSTDEDAPLSASAPGVLGNDADVDGDTLSAVLVTGPAHGTLTLNADGSFTYTPAADFSGSDGFTYKVNDGAADSANAAVTIDVTSLNDAPAASDQSVTTPEDTAAGITLAGTDADGDSLTYTVLTSPAHGTLSGTGANLTYTPHADYNGADSFTFKASDGTADSGTATVSVTVTAVNDLPVASNQSVVAIKNTAKAITLAATDVDGGTLTYAIVAAPAHGTLSGTGANRTYTPAADYVGPDSFTFKASDGTADSNTATVSVTVNESNTAPVANDDSYSTNEDVSLVVAIPGLLANDTDAEGGTLTAVKLTNPLNGTITAFGTKGSFTYKPKLNFHGTDSFTYKINDGTLESASATVSITVNPVNDAPVASKKTYTLLEDKTKVTKVSATDADGDSLTYSVVTPPANGTLSGTAPDLIYTPAPDFNGTDSFTYKANDGTVDSNVATVSLTITAVADPPKAGNLSPTTPEDTPLSITLAGSDPDGDAVTYTVLTSPANGALSGTAPDLTYTPNADYHGADSFTYKVNDGTSDSNTATVSITVSPVNDAPVAADQSAVTVSNLSKAIPLPATDADGDSLTYSVVTPPANGTLSGTGASRTYTPGSGFVGIDTFTYKANDGTVDSNVATVTVTVQAANDPPIANNDTYTVLEDRNLAITTAAAGVLANDTDTPGTVLTATLITGPSNGSLTLNANGTFTYRSKSNFHGTDSFTYKANDGLSDSNVATTTVTITPVNDAPVANAQTVDLLKNESEAVTLTATDVDGDSLTYSVVTPPTKGTLSGTGGNLTYTPNLNYVGADSFTFRATDPTGANSNTATVSINVHQLDANVIAVNDEYVVKNPNHRISASKGLLINDKDNLNRGALTAILETPPAHGTVTVRTTGEFTYFPDAGYFGPDSFTYRAKAAGGGGVSTPATVDLKVEYEVVTSVNFPVIATVPVPLAGENVQVNGTLRVTAMATWNYQVKALNDTPCVGELPVFYHTNYDVVGAILVGTAVGTTTGDSYTVTVASTKHDLCVQEPPIDWHRTINLKVTKPGVSQLVSFSHTIHANPYPDGTSIVPPVLDGNLNPTKGSTVPQFGYVTNPGANTVSVVNTGTRKVVKTIPVGTNPAGIAKVAGDKFVLVANAGSDSVSVIEVAAHAVVATIPVGDDPRRVVTDGLGKRAYVANQGSNSISVIDTTNWSVVDTIDATDGLLGLAPVGLAINHTSTRLYVAMTGSNSLAVIDTAGNTFAGLIPLPASPGEVAVKPGGAEVWVGLPSLGSVSAIDTATNSEVASVAVGTDPAGLAFAIPGHRLVVANTGSNSLSVIDTENHSVVKTIVNAGMSSPTSVSMIRTGMDGFVTSTGSNSLLQVRLQTTHEVRIVNNVVGSSPAGLAPSQVVHLH